MTKIENIKNYLKEQIASETDPEKIKAVGDMINGLDDVTKEQDELMKRYTTLHESYVKQIMSTPTEREKEQNETKPFDEDKELENIIDKVAIDL